MSPAELRKEMKLRKRELRRQLPALRKAARARVDQIPAIQRARLRRRRIRRAIGAAIIVLLLLLIRCDCGPGAPLPIEKAEVVPPEVKPKKGVVKIGPRKPLEGDASKRQRGNLGLPAAAPPTWIDEFQIQVAARSPRLALCFTGIDRPGALRWSTSVNAKSGAVSEHELEPVGLSDDLRGDQRICVLKVLSNPPYKLTAPEKEALPDRVSLVIEF